jgi:hypothetical protein
VTQDKIPLWRTATRWGILLGFLAVLFAAGASLVSSASWYRSMSVTVPLACGCLIIVAGGISNYRWLGTGLVRRKILIVANVSAMILLALAATILLNLITSRHYTRFDLTQKGIFTLSTQTIDLLSSLPRKVAIHAIFKEDPKTSWTRGKVKDLLEEYAARSPQIEFTVLNADLDMEKTQEFLRTLKTPPDRASIVFQSGTEERIIPWDSLIETADSTTSAAPRFKGEQVLTTAIKAVVSGAKRGVYFTTGHGERDSVATDINGCSTFVRFLEQENYKVSAINLEQLRGMPVDCAVLIIAGPREAFSPAELEVINAYLGMQGGLLAMLDPKLALGSSQGISDILSQCNITVRDDVVTMQPKASSPPVSLVICEPARKDHPVTRGLTTLSTFLFSACALEAKRASQSGEPGKAAFVPIPLLYVGAGAWGETHGQDPKRALRMDPGEDVAGPLVVAMAAQTMLPADNPQQSPKEVPGARIVVVADSDFASNQLFDRVPGNRQFLTNAVAWLDQKGLPPATIPAQDLDLRQITKFNERKGIEILLVCGVVMPLLSLLCGIVVWLVRR